MYSLYANNASLCPVDTSHTSCVSALPNQRLCTHRIATHTKTHTIEFMNAPVFVKPGRTFGYTQSEI